MTSCIYAIINKVNGKYYIGSTKDYDKRWICHINRLRNNNHHAIKLQKAFNKYGEDMFMVCVLEEVKDSSKLLQREQKWLDTTECYKVGYNTNKEAHTYIRKTPLSEEHKHNIGKGNTGKIRSEEVKMQISNTLSGRKQSPDSIAKRVDKLIGKVRSNEQRERYRQSKLGSKAPSAKLTDEQVLEILERLRQGETGKNLAKIYGVSMATISMIKSGQRWGHLQERGQYGKS